MKIDQRHPAQPQRPVHDRLRIDAADHHRDRGDAAIGQDVRQRQRALRVASVVAMSSVLPIPLEA